MQNTFSKDSIGSVVVTYNPDPAILFHQLDSLKTQVGTIFLVDNGSLNAEDIVKTASSIRSTKLLFCEKNQGLGRAHNIGIQACRDAGHDAVLLLDQDTIPSNDMVSKLLLALNRLTQSSNKTSAVGARFIGNSGHSSFFVQFSRFRFQKIHCTDSKYSTIIPADMLISSGSLIPMAAVDAIGNMDETLFIDHIDTDWFLRAKSLRWQAYGVCDALMEHRLGEKTLRVWFGRWRNLPIHLPFRYYFIYRNSILLRRRRYTDPNWRRADIIRLILIAVILPLSSNKTLTCFRMILLGITHGLKGKSGPLIG